MMTAIPMMTVMTNMGKKYFTVVSYHLVLIRLVRPGDAYKVIGKFEMRSGQFHFGHMAGGAVLCIDPATGRRGLIVRFLSRPRRFPAGGMAGQAFRVVISRVFIERFVRVMASGTAYAAVVRITLAVKYPVRLEADVVYSHTFQSGGLTGPAMTGGAEILCQFIAAESRGIEDQFGARPPCFTRGHVIRAGAVTGFTPDAERQFVQSQLGSADRPGRMTAETTQRFILRETPPDGAQQGFRRLTRRANRKIKPLDLIVKAHEALVILAFMLQHVGLPGLASSEGEKDWQ